MGMLIGMAWRGLWQHSLRTLLSIAGVMFGVGLIFSAVSVGAVSIAESGSQERHYVQLRALPNGGDYLPESAAEKIQVVKGVWGVAPTLSFTAVMPSNTSAALTVRGIVPKADAILHRRVLVQGGSVLEDGQIVVPVDWAERHQIKIGSTLNLLIAMRPLPRALNAKVVGFSPAAGADFAPDSLVTLATLQQAVGLSGKVSQFEIRFENGTNSDAMAAEVQKAVGQDMSLSTLFPLESNPIIDFIVNLVLGIAGFAILLTAAYLIFNTFAMTLAERRIEIGRLVALGMTPQQATRSVLIEATIIGVGGSLLGLVLGALLVVPVQLAVGNATGQPNKPIALSLFGAILAVLLGLAMTLIASFPIAWQAGQVSPLEMIFPLRSGKIQRFRRPLWFGLGIAVFAVLLMIGVAFGLGGPISPIASMAQNTLLLGLLLMVPVLLIGWFGFLSRRLGNRVGLTVGLALSNLERQPTRAALAASAMTIVTSTTLMMAALSGAISSGQNGAIKGFLNADYMVTGGGNNVMINFVSGKLSANFDPALFKTLDGMKDKLTYGRMGLVITPELTGLPGFAGGVAYDIEPFLSTQGEGRFVGATNADVRKTFEAGPAIILAQNTAAQLNAKVGDTITLTTPRGPAAFKVAALENRVFFSYLDYKQAEQAFGAVILVTVGVLRNPGVAASAVEPELEAAVQSNGLQLTKVDRFIGDQIAFFSGLGAAFSAMGLIMMIVAALGILGTMYTSVMERRRELGMLAAVGSTPSQLRNMVLIESLIIGLSGAIPGVVIGLGVGLLTGPLNQLADRAAGMHMWDAIQLTVPWMVLAVSLIGAPAVALLAAWIPARKVAAMQIVEALRYE